MIKYVVIKKMKYNKDGYLIQKASDRNEFVSMLKQDNLTYSKIITIRKQTEESLGIYVVVK